MPTGKKSDEDLIDDPKAVSTRVELRVGGRIVYMQSLYGYAFEATDDGFQVTGTVDPPKVKRAKPTAPYNPVKQEPPTASTVTSTTTSTVPATEDPAPQDATESTDGKRE